MTLLIAIDDTDNMESRGTGFLSRKLATDIERKGLGIVRGITRHQLYVHNDIAYTSQNSSACLEVEEGDVDGLKEMCAEFLLTEAAEGSDAGLCIADWDAVSDAIVEWGKRAKQEVLTLEACVQLANQESVFIKGLTGTRIGQIGALAAVGLRKDGNDGRFIWLKGTGELREFDSGIYSASELKKAAGINVIQSEEGKEVPDTHRIQCSGWTRPILNKNESVLLVENVNFADYEWRTISKEYIRKVS